MLTLLTMTGCRPEAWAICTRLMARQDYAGPVRWVIVDDGESSQEYGDLVDVTCLDDKYQRCIKQIPFREDWQVEVVRPDPYWREGQNTQARNIVAGLAVIKPHERVVVIEDDDYYGPGYLSAVDEWLNYADLVGESHARYFNVATQRGKRLSNVAHASLCSTAMKGSAIDMLRRVAVPGRQFIDIELWRRFQGTKRMHRTSHIVGIKGLPGRGGIGTGHREQFGEPMQLSDWIGEEANIYG